MQVMLMAVRGKEDASKVRTVEDGTRTIIGCKSAKRREIEGSAKDVLS